MPKPISRIIGFAWLAAALLLTWRPFLWHVEFFRIPIFKIMLAMSPLLLAAFYWIRRRRWWQYELAALAAFPVAAAFVYETRAAAVALWIFLACYASGRFLRRKLGLETAGVPEEIAVSSGIGFGILLCALFALGMAGLYYGWVFAILLGLPSILFWREVAALGPELRGCHQLWIRTPRLATALGALLVAFGAVFLLFTVMVVLAPSLTFDVLAMHLPSAEFYAASHAVRPVPNISYSYFPQGIESLMALGYVLAGQPAAQMLPPVFFALALLVAFHLARESGADRFTAAGGVVFAMSAPFLHWSGGVAKNDLALAFFLLAALDAWLRWRATQNFRWIQLGVFFLATGSGLKHIVALALPAFGLLFAWAAWRQKHRVRALATLAAIFLAFGLLWQVRTFLLVGNPLYPLRSSQVGVPGGHAVRLLTLPWDIHFHGERFFESPLPNPLGISLLVFAPLWFLNRKKLSVAERAILLFVALYGLGWAATTAVVTLRYAIAPFLLLYLLTARRVFDFEPVAVFAASAYCLLFALAACIIIEINVPQIRLFTGRIDNAEYLREALATYRSLEFVRARWKPGEWLLGFGNCSFAYGPDPLRFNCILETNDPGSPARVQRERAARRYDFVVVPAGPLERAVMGDSASPLYRDSNFAVYQPAQAGSR